MLVLVIVFKLLGKGLYLVTFVDITVVRVGVTNLA